VINMKPFDPEHKGEFCFSDRPDFDRILCTDAPGDCPIKVLTKGGGIVHCDATGLSGSAGVRLMCVIPKREARMITLNGNGDFIRVPSKNGPSAIWAGVSFREDMPDDISQEKARAVIEAARAVLATIYEPVQPTHPNDVFDALRTALGDDA